MENNEIIIHKLNRIEKHIFGLKTILNVEELSDYTGFKKSYIYKLVHTNSIPFSKPSGKILFFERKKIDEWLLKNSHKSNDDVPSNSFHAYAFDVNEFQISRQECLATKLFFNDTQKLAKTGSWFFILKPKS